MRDPIFPHPEPVVAPPLAHMDALPVGTMLGEFELQGLLGVGGFGMVYRGYDHSLHRAVAIKEYMPSALVGRAADMQVSARSSADSQPFLVGLNSFIAEARLLARFDHPSLVKVYRFWEANNTAYMAMPLYSGITLKQARSQMNAPPPEEWLRAVLWSVLEALKVLHGSNTLHRDVSPDNIFLQDVGPPVLLDLGAARRAIVDSSHKHTAILKVNYAPIEQYADAQDLQEGPWTDLYAVAAVMHGCLCNEPPLPATFRVLRDRMPSCARVAKTVETHFGLSYSATFIKTVDHALAIQPAMRPQSVEAFVREIHLRSPKDMPRFDWRARLGVGVTLSDAPSPQALLPTRPQAHASAPVDVTVPRGAATDRSLDKSPGHQDATRLRIRWGWGLLVVGIAIAAGYYMVQRTAINRQTAPLAPLVSETVAPTVTPVSEPKPVFAPVLAPATAPQRTESPAKGKDAERRVPVREKEVIVAAPAKPDGARAAGTGMRPDPERLCADRNFLAHSLCVHSECQKPEFSGLAVCLDDRKRWDNAAK
jgi:non-specific serine/threonine protein kinase